MGGSIACRMRARARAVAGKMLLHRKLACAQQIIERGQGT